MGSIFIYGDVDLLYRLKKVLYEDFSFILPGGYPFTGETFFRILLYIGLITVLIVLMLPDDLYNATMPFLSPPPSEPPAILFEGNI